MAVLARVAATALAADALASSLPAQPSAPPADPSYRLYLAATAAAEGDERHRDEPGHDDHRNAPPGEEGGF